MDDGGGWTDALGLEWEPSTFVLPEIPPRYDAGPDECDPGEHYVWYMTNVGPVPEPRDRCRLITHPGAFA